MRFVVGTATLLALAGLACGPSFQTVYENDARFEHCYALDETPTAAMPKKADCWNDWSKNHTYGQTRDRVEYARARYDALSNPQLPTDEGMAAAAPGEGTDTDTAAAPTPTSAFAPPPKMESRDGGPPAPPLSTWGTGDAGK